MLWLVMGREAMASRDFGLKYGFRDLLECQMDIKVFNCD